MRGFKERIGSESILESSNPLLVTSAASYLTAIVVLKNVPAGNYRVCLERLGLAADATLFVDDRLENIQAAREIGIQTLHFLGDSSVSDLKRTLALD